MEEKSFEELFGDLRPEQERFQRETNGELIPVFLGFKSQIIMVFYAGPLSAVGVVPIGSVEFDTEDKIIRAVPIMNLKRHFPKFCKEFKMGEIVDAFIWIKKEFEEQIEEHKKKVLDDAVETYSCGNPAHDNVWRSIFKMADDAVPGSVAHMAREKKKEQRAKNAASIMDKAQKMYQENTARKSKKGNGVASTQEEKMPREPVIPYVRLNEESEVQEEPRLEVVNPDNQELPKEYPTKEQIRITELICDLKIYNVNLEEESSLGRDYIKPYRYNGPVYKEAHEELWRLLKPIQFGIVLDSPEDGAHDVPPEKDAVLIGEIQDEYLRVLRQFWAYKKVIREGDA